ncbi:MAG: hypothetical protein GX963_11010 [Bacteroidales bacterium]|nr:hypothetical protein [Bacteroidales bacterium]
MKTSNKKNIIIVGVIVLLLVVGLAFSNGSFSSPRDTHPPYDQLPSVEEATEALAKNQALAKEIEALGDGIVLEVSKPFPEHQDRGLIVVRYATRSQRNAIADLLGQREGFGVPVHLKKR